MGRTAVSIGFTDTEETPRLVSRAKTPLSGLRRRGDTYRSGNTHTRRTFIDRSTKAQRPGDAQNIDTKGVGALFCYANKTGWLHQNKLSCISPRHPCFNTIFDIATQIYSFTQIIEKSMPH